ncbi:hypothetical protein K469DRAFT_646028 [Zopfia rhizophila CBS 207.26]|uniref:Tc1-like transposase DDE domain-containing protein n=1 Tax=Zopfia rhizophila CBS 207.26 TaxID=1314779 RepID=A0A6A6DF88_9PEZI|nr:hypothetical protein K469DRAFT_646028 [Zopfia rhizophila CBS 207.26]
MENNWEKPLFGYWDQVYFTDEAHYNVTGYYQAPRVLREQGERKNPENQAEEHEQLSEWALHIKALSTSTAKMTPQNNLLPTPKPPGKPRKKKNETWEQYSQRIADWEASRPPEVELRITGAHMTQKYYTKKLLPEYIQAISKARLRDENKSYYLQEDGDPSHSTKSFGNVAYNAKEMNWIDRIVHPAQSPDLNAIEGI